MAAQNGTLYLIGKSGKVYAIDTYLPDAVGTLATFNLNGAAVSTSSATFKVPEDCIMHDFSLATAPTAVGSLIQKNNANIVGGAIRYTNQLAALPNRTRLRMPFNQGDELGMVQF